MKNKNWSDEVTKHSNAMDLEPNVFTLTDSYKIAESLKRSAQQSLRLKGTPFRSAMNMLTFYINQAGKNLKKMDKQRLEKAKDELRTLFDQKS